MVNDWNKINIMIGGEPEVLHEEDIPKQRKLKMKYSHQSSPHFTL